MAATLVRAGSSWVKVAGERISPRYVFVVDKIGKHLIDDIGGYEIGELDQVVQFQNGSFENIQTYFDMQSRQYTDAKAVVCLWVGMEDLAEEVPENAQIPPEHFHPLGPRIIPRLDVADTISAYHDLLDSLAISLPSSVVVSTAPAPRRSAGFANRRAEKVGKGISKRFPLHHHIGVRQGFVCQLKGKDAARLPGGRCPINPDRFLDDGMTPDIESFQIVIRRCYAALSVFLELPPVFPESLVTTVMWF